MKYIFSKNKIITGLLTGGILLSSVSTTFAATAKPLHFDKILLTKKYKQMNTKTQQGLKINFENIVTGKTITQNQANKIKAVINKDEPTKEANFEKTKTVTEQGRKIYMDSNKINHINRFIALVDNGTITEAQAEKIIMKQIYLYHVKRK